MESLLGYFMTLLQLYRS